MNAPLKNPCRECDHHLAGGDKNVCECTNCEDRIAYVNAIGNHPSAPVNENVYLEGGGGHDLKKNVDDNLKILSELEQMENKKKTAPDPPDTPENLQSEKDQNRAVIMDPIRIEVHIRDICHDAGMTIEQIRANAKNIHDKQALKLFHETRDRIIISLASGDFGRLSQTKIAKYLRISNHVVSTRMKVAGIRPMYPSGAQQKKPKTPAPAKPKKDKKTPDPEIHVPDPAQLTLRLDFTGFPEIYDDLQALAAQEIRTIENQALYILKQIHAQGLKIKEL